MTDGLTARQSAFVAEYLIDRNGAQAAIRAGYSPKGSNVHAVRLLANVNVAAALAEGERALAVRTELKQEMVVNELRKLGFSNMLDYITVQENGTAITDLSKLTRDQAAAITEFTVEEYIKGTGKNAKPVRRTKIKLADKRSALVDLGKHIGMFKDGPAVPIAIGINISADDASL